MPRRSCCDARATCPCFAHDVASQCVTIAVLQCLGNEPFDFPHAVRSSTATGWRARKRRNLVRQQSRVFGPVGESRDRACLPER